MVVVATRDGGDCTGGCGRVFCMGGDDGGEEGGVGFRDYWGGCGHVCGGGCGGGGDGEDGKRGWNENSGE